MFMSPDSTQTLTGLEPPHPRPAAAERRLAAPVVDQQPAEQHPAQVGEVGHARLQAGEAQQQLDRAVDDHQRARLHRDRRDRSEEHTSELQSLMRISYAVFCLKKKKITYITKT